MRTIGHSTEGCLGHHWAYRRETGEPQITFNYCRALSDFLTNFTFGKGIHFRSPKQTEAIVPSRLKRVWEVDNDKDAVLWEIGNLGSVTGDVFVKVAYEEPMVDAIGRVHPGRVRILPLNPSFSFPEWHPHDRTRLLRFRQRYRFWGTAADGTRQVFTYTEIITDDQIEEYINDELMDSRPNPLGMIPVIHIPNVPVSGSPWGLADIHDITSLNREYNEKATAVSDIINYHAEPVTIITGAKASQLEKGAKKIWAGLPSDAQVFNLELGGNLAAPLEYLAQIKQAMHELTGVPEGALGKKQEISNTSGVALAIQYQPLMNRYNLKRIHYGRGFKRLNEIIMLTLAVKEPESLLYNPSIDPPLKEGQVPELDPSDPITYQSSVFWTPPLPTDILVKLNEEQAKMGLGVQSKRGLLRELGYEEPEEKIEEVIEELKEDTMEQAALDLLKATLMNQIMMVSGTVPGTDGQPVPVGGPSVTSAGGPDVTTAGAGSTGPVTPTPLQMFETGEEQNLLAELVTRAYGTRAAQRRNPQQGED